MKKPLCFIHNQKGFVLPYILFISALVLMIVTSSINIYRNDVQLTHQHQEQLKIETLFQMSRAKFKEKLSELPKPRQQEDAVTVNYEFSQGNVEISYFIQRKNTYHLYFIITTNNDSTYKIINKFPLDKKTE